MANAQEQGSEGSQQVKGLPAACVFVPFINSETTEERLKKHFESLYGPVMRATSRKERTSPRPFAFIQFVSVDDANKALADSERQRLDGQLIKIERAKVNSTLFCAKIPKSLDNAGLRAICEQFGLVERVAILFDPATFESKGCGFVKYMYREDARDAQRQIQAQHPKWVVDWAKSTKEFEKGDIDRHTIYVGGINCRHISEEMIRERFGQHGEIETITFIKPPEDQVDRDGYCFIRFADKLCAAKALETEQNVEWHGKHLRVDYPDPPSIKQEKKLKKEATPQHAGALPWAPPPPPKFDPNPPRNMMPHYPPVHTIPPPMAGTAGDVPPPGSAPYAYCYYWPPPLPVNRLFSHWL